MSLEPVLEQKRVRTKHWTLKQQNIKLYLQRGFIHIVWPEGPKITMKNVI